MGTFAPWLTYRLPSASLQTTAACHPDVTQFHAHTTDNADLLQLACGR